LLALNAKAPANAGASFSIYIQYTGLNLTKFQTLFPLV
jgi:hypothetical protein